MAFGLVPAVSLIKVRAELPPPRPDATPSLVCYVLDSRSLGPGMSPKPEVVDRMVSAVVCGVTGKTDISSAWRSLIHPGDRVGIKISAQPGPVGGTHPAVAKAVVDGLIEAGIPSRNIVVWDRRREDLVSCGYDSVPGLNLRWVEGGGGFDPRAVVTAPAIGKLVYGDLSFKESRTFDDLLGPKSQLSEESHLPVLLSRDIDKVINIPSLCDSFFTGVHGAMASMTIGTLDNWRRFGRGEGYGDSALAGVYGDERLGGKVVLTILDGTVIQYAGGPYPSPVNCAASGTIFASRDPVAIDATALRLLDEQRLLSRMPKASDNGGHVEEAASRGLGNASGKEILLRRIGGG